MATPASGDKIWKLSCKLHRWHHRHSVMNGSFCMEICHFNFTSRGLNICKQRKCNLLIYVLCWRNIHENCTFSIQKALSIPYCQRCHLCNLRSLNEHIHQFKSVIWKKLRYGRYQFELIFDYRQCWLSYQNTFVMALLVYNLPNDYCSSSKKTSVSSSDT